MKIEGGSGGKRGHSNMTHWDYTEEIKRRSRKARRAEGRTLERKARQVANLINDEFAVQATIVTARSQIDEFARQIGEHFQPEKIILFGSHACGNPNEDSDVDLLVVMPRNGKSPYQQAIEIRQRVSAGFPLDLLVRTPEEVEKRMGMNDWFMHDLMREGITLYAA